MKCVVMSNAAEALIGVILINRDGEDPANVHGPIISKTSSFNDRIDLFHKPERDYVTKRPKGIIPLLRPALAVPMNVTFEVTAVLRDHDTHEIANGTATFVPTSSIPTSAFITGQKGKIEVRVSWM